MRKTNFTESSDFNLSDEQIAEIEKSVQDEPALQACDNCYVIPDEKNQTIDIMSDTNDMVLHLNKQTAIVLAAILQDCVNGWA